MFEGGIDWQGWLSIRVGNFEWSRIRRERENLEELGTNKWLDTQGLGFEESDLIVKNQVRLGGMVWSRKVWVAGMIAFIHKMEWDGCVTIQGALPIGLGWLGARWKGFPGMSWETGCGVTGDGGDIV